MQDKPTPENMTRGDRNFGEMERAVLYLLTDPQRYPTIWSLPDLGREIEYFDADAVVYPLRRAGLIHRIGEFVFATPAAFHWVGMVGHVD
jgi:hypothetical protein